MCIISSKTVFFKFFIDSLVSLILVVLIQIKIFSGFDGVPK